MAEEKLFAYPCEEAGECLSLLASGASISFVDFCKLNCAVCSDCVWLDIPYPGDGEADG